MLTGELKIGGIDVRINLVFLSKTKEVKLLFFTLIMKVINWIIFCSKLVLI